MGEGVLAVAVAAGVLGGDGDVGHVVTPDLGTHVHIRPVCDV